MKLIKLPRLLPAFILWLFASLYHLQFSLFLVNPVNSPWGIIKLKDYAIPASYFLLFCLLSYLVWSYFKGHKRSIFYIWLLWLAAIALINLFLMATPVENIHFLQYALIALLFLWGISPNNAEHPLLIAKALFWLTIAGIIDELLQYFWITLSYSKHIDFNDFLLNLMGSIAGILIYTGMKSNQTVIATRTLPLKQSLKSWEVRLVLLFTLLFVSLSHSNNMERQDNILGSWQPAFNGGEYYVLAPLEGSLLLFLTGFIFLKLLYRENH